MGDIMMIDCGRCRMRGAGCPDCVVSVIEPPRAAGHLGREELRALRVLADAGLVPPLRLKLAGPPRHVYPESKAFPETRAS
jgi:hypothetical protein